MSYNESNNEFFSYQGTINRKDYIINILIIISLLIGISLVKFDNFAPYIKPEFLYKVLMFMVYFFQFVMLMSVISLVYRRIADFSSSKSVVFISTMKKLFAILFIFPVLYIFCFRYFINIIPILQNTLDIITTFLLLPLGFLSMIIFAFLKGE